MHMFKTMAALALAMSTPVLAQEGAPPPMQAHLLEKADVDSWLDGLVPYALQAGDMAGAVVTVVANGQVLTNRGFGTADAETGTPVDPEIY